MRVTVETTTGLERRLSVEIPEERLQGEIDKRLDSLAKEARVPGFRAGKVPRKVIEQKYGDAIRHEAKESLINRAFQNALSEHELEVVGRPRIEGLDEKPLSASEPVEAAMLKSS